MRLLFRMAVGVGILTFCSSCVERKHPAAIHRPGELNYPRNAPVPEYAIVVVNHRRQMLSNVDARFGYPTVEGNNPTPEFGILGTGAFKGDHFIPVPIPDRVRISWTDADGKNYAREVEVLALVGAKFSGDIIFNIEIDGTVNVTTEK